MPPCAERMNLLFSATLSYRVRELAFEQMNNPNTLKLNRNSVPVTGSKKSYSIRPTKKMRFLQTLLEEEGRIAALFSQYQNTAVKISGRTRRLTATVSAC